MIAIEVFVVKRRTSLAYNVFRAIKRTSAMCSKLHEVKETVEETQMKPLILQAILKKSRKVIESLWLIEITN